MEWLGEAAFRGVLAAEAADDSRVDCESLSARLVGAGGSGMQTIMHELDYPSMKLPAKKQRLRMLFLAL